VSAGGVAYPALSAISCARAASTSVDFGSATCPKIVERVAMSATAISATTASAKAGQATIGRRSPTAPAAATISGDGVSPAASAAASGSPPGSEAITAWAEGGRLFGSSSRQRAITRSTAGSMSRTMLDTLGVFVEARLLMISCSVPSYRRRPVNISKKIRPSA
jgi:hypothetical protein